MLIADHFYYFIKCSLRRFYFEFFISPSRKILVLKNQEEKLGHQEFQASHRITLTFTIKSKVIGMTNAFTIIATCAVVTTGCFSITESCKNAEKVASIVVHYFFDDIGHKKMKLTFTIGSKIVIVALAFTINITWTIVTAGYFGITKSCKNLYEFTSTNLNFSIRSKHTN